MLIANESNWRTDDLEALVESLRNQPGFKEGYQIRSNTLLLFVTGNPKKTPARGGVVVEPPAATGIRNPRRWSDTVVVKIRSRCQLRLEVLDRMSHIGHDYEQDMKAADVERVASAIAEAIGSWECEKFDYSWARKMSLRHRPNVTWSKEAGEREVLALLDRKDDIKRSTQDRLRKIDQQINRIRAQRGY